MLVIRVSVLVLLVFQYVCTSNVTCGPKNCKNLDSSTIICTDIPTCIPDDITRVKVQDTSIEYPMVTNLNFTGHNWNKVTYLQILDFAVTGSRSWTISNASFVALHSLRELHIIIKSLTIDPNALVGLPSVIVINFSCSKSLSLYDLQALFNGTDKVPNVNEFILWEWNDKGKPFNFDDSFVDMLLPRNITIIDLTKSTINILNLTTIVKRLQNLKLLNISRATVNDIYTENLRIADIQNIDILDISGPAAGLSLPGSRILPTVNSFNNSVYELQGDHWFLQSALAFPKIYASRIFFGPTSISINNYTINSEGIYHFYVKELELSENNLNRLDLKINEPSKITSDLEYLGLTNNNMEYLHHSLLSCMPNLTFLVLSNNSLYKMVDEDVQQFEIMLSGVPALRYIFLSNNNLKHIPSKYFINSKMLVYIDLSYNMLTQITFDVRDLQLLEFIDLSGNEIKYLDAASLQLLSNLPNGLQNNSIVLTLNPISCSQCRDTPFLKWVLSTTVVNVKSQNLECTNAEGDHVEIDDVIASGVQYICIRNAVIISSTLSAVFLFTFSVSFTVWLYQRRIRKNIIAHRQAVVEKIRQGVDEYQFTVFLSFCSKDDEFIVDKVRPNLEYHLHAITGINNDRKLVSTGDVNLRPGFYVHDEIDSCIEMSSVVIILVTEDYCNSNYCLAELEKSYIKRRPVILMFKDYVNENLMSKTMKELYKKKVRILWAKQNDEYVLQTTWENICLAIIDLIK